jgi:hypothetical protein
VVTAVNEDGESAPSNEMNAMPQVAAPGAPVLQSATPGDGKVQLSWTPVPGAAGYQVFHSETSGTYGSATATVTGSVYELTGLTNGTTYYFIVKATNPGGDSAASNEVSAKPVAPSSNNSGGGGGPSAGTTSPTNEADVVVTVNGKAEQAGKAATVEKDGRKITTIVVDEKKIEERLAGEGAGALIVVAAPAKADEIVAEWNGRLVKSMADKQAVIELRTDRGVYTLPAQEVIAQLGGGAKLEEVKVQVVVSEASSQTSALLERAAEKGRFKVAEAPLEFAVWVQSGDRTTEIARFNGYVARSLTIPEGTGAITTGIVLEADGSIRHVPTKIVVRDGRYYATINSLTNSTYALVRHEKTFADIGGHWARKTIEDMASRFVVDGTAEDRFAPDRDVSRAEFTAILVRALGLRLETGSASFTDVKSADWFGAAVNTAQAYGLIDGYADGTFRPEERITREQAMTIVVRAISLTGLKGEQSPTAVLSRFKDEADAAEWAKASIAASVSAGILTGRTETTLAPKAYMTRAETATLMSRLLERSGLI